MYICLWNAEWQPAVRPPGVGGGAPAAALLLAELAPRLRVDSEVIWADGRGLDAVKLAGALLDRLVAEGMVAGVGVAAVPVVAELAARSAVTGPDAPTTPFLVKERTGWGHRAPSDHRGIPPSPRPSDSTGPGGRPAQEDADLAVAAGAIPQVVAPGTERSWLSPLPLRLLASDPSLGSLLAGVGIGTLGELAALDREAVEVRFGPAAVALWRLARADDRRVLFRPVPPERPCGSIDFVDYVLTDPARLLFTANALLTPLCDRLVGRGEHARALRLVLPLANGQAWERTIRPARPTASRETWLRLIRGLLDRLTVPDAVTGMSLEVVATEPAAVLQGDLFDRGFATASAVEAAIARLAERNVAPLVAETNGHPLVERRGELRSFELRASSFELRKADGGASRSMGRGSAASGQGGSERGLALQLLAEPRRVLVDSARRRDHEAPVRLRDRGEWREVVLAAGPDRISGGRWEPEPYAREYYRCVTDEGMPLWVYRDGRDGEWYLHGWWD